MLKKYSIALIIFCLILTGNNKLFAQDNQTPSLQLKTSAKEINVIIPSRDGNSFFVGGWDYNIYQIDATSGETIKTIEGAGATIVALNLSLDEKLLISGHENGAVGVWEVESGKRLNFIRSHEGPVMGVCFSQDEKSNFFYSAGDDGQIKKYDRNLLGKWIGTAEVGNPIKAMQISPNGNALYVGDANGNIAIYNTSDMQKNMDFPSKHSNSVYSLAISTDGKMLLSGGGDKIIKLWDLVEKKELKSFSGHTWKVLSVAFNRSQEYIISSSNDGSIKTWNISTGQLIQTYSLARRKTFSAAQFNHTASSFVVGGQVDKFNPSSIYFWNTGLSSGADVIYVPEEIKKEIITPKSIKPGSKKITPKKK